MQPGFRLRRAAHILHSGGVIAYPTEGVYGVGCIPDNESALARLLALKGRSADAGLILIAADTSLLGGWIDPSPDEAARLRETHPHPVTWVVTAGPLASPLLTGGRPTLAVRIIGHPLAAALSRAARSPLVSTSANRSGKPPALTALEARIKLSPGLDLILAGPLGGARGPSEIRRASDNGVLRPGPQAQSPAIL